MRRYGESKTHDDCKERIARICIRKGWTVKVDTHKFECNTEKGARTYWPDVYAENFCELSWKTRARAFHSPDALENVDTRGGKEKSGKQSNGARRIVVEVQGPKGHNTKLATRLDDSRLANIRAAHGDELEFYEVQLAKRGQKRGANDVRNWSDEDIIEELNLDPDS